MIEPGQHRMDTTRLPTGRGGCPVEQQPIDLIEENDVSAFLRRGKRSRRLGLPGITRQQSRSKRARIGLGFILRTMKECPPLSGNARNRVPREHL